MSLCPECRREQHRHAPYCPQHPQRIRERNQREHAERRRAVRNQERAERIARATGWKAWPGITDEQIERVILAMTAAALRGIETTQGAIT